jgi:uroporphyrin-III C-methyltransferase
MIPTIFTFHKAPRVTLVGAGPGDPELITLKAVNCLKSADVVLFDALVSTEILKLIPEGVPALSVGKRAGVHSYSQDEINEMIVELAYIHGHVVRLKGGDPFVFGRGREEIEYAEAHGLRAEVIPGISSCIAVPAALNIPVTSRGVSESFWVITGTTKQGELSNDIKLAAQSRATVVILMGMNRLKSIMECFRENGKSDTPVAIIQNGTMANQKSVIGTVSNIESLTSIEDLASPGIIVVGEVVRSARDLGKAIDSASVRNYE